MTIPSSQKHKILVCPSHMELLLETLTIFRTINYRAVDDFTLSPTIICVCYVISILYIYLNYYWSDVLVCYNESLFLSCVFMMLIVSFGVWIKCTNNGEIISVQQRICVFYRQKYQTDSDYIFYSALHNSISLGECNLVFFLRHTFLSCSRKLPFPSDTVQVTVKMNA